MTYLTTSNSSVEQFENFEYEHVLSDAHKLCKCMLYNWGFLLLWGYFRVQEKQNVSCFICPVTQTLGCMGYPDVLKHTPVQNQKENLLRMDFSQ